ncbi:CpaE family protein [Phenylobacterium sp.]|uniref:AAA family ATPase n=1 Tax=Phenylobacterium sp. TaxID=1871053 RepID=UPI0035B1B6BD
MTRNLSLALADVRGDLARDLQAAAARLAGLRILSPTGAGAVSADAWLLALEDTGPAGLERLRNLVGRIGGAPVVVVAPEADSLAVRQLFRAGARDVLAGPQDAGSLAAALHDLFQPAAAAERPRGAVISVLKGCGGAGATTLALNLAAVAVSGSRRARPLSSVVLDLDLQFGDSDVALDLQPRTGVLDLIKSGGKLDARLLDSVLADHSSGLRLLGPAPALTPLDALPAELALDVVDLAAARFDRVFVDLPPAWTDWTPSLLARSDLVILVTMATVGGVLGARRVLDAMNAAGVAPPCLLVLNRVAGVLEAIDKPARVQRALAAPVDAAIPFDAQLARAVERGRLVAEAAPKAPAARAVRALLGAVDARLAAGAPARLEAAE